MTRPTLLRIAPIALVALAAGLGAYACSDSTSPGQSSGRTATLVITPSFAVPGAASVVPLKKAHIAVNRSSGTVALDTTVTLPSSLRSIALDEFQFAAVIGPITVTVPLARNAPEDFTLRLALLDASGNVIFQGGPVSLHGDPTTPTPGTIPEAFVGTGSTANSVTVSPTTSTVAPSAAATFTAHALTSTGTEIPGTPVLWTSLDPSIATFPDPSVGHAVAGSVRGTAHVRATLLTGQTADATLLVQPTPSSIAIQSGSGQTGVPGTPAGAPLVVIAKATDGLGIGGVPITFAIQSGGGSLSATQITTGADGLASVTYTFSPNAGAVIITATSTGLTGSPLSFSLTGVAGTPTQVAFTTQPTNGFVGTPLSPIVVEVRDQSGNRVTTYTGSVSLSFLTAPAGGATLSGTTVSAVGGVATFSAVNASAAFAGAQLVATATGAAGTATSSAFSVTVRPAVALGFSVQPPSVIPAQSAFPSSVVVQALDAVGGVVTSYNGTITLALDSPPSGVALQGATTATAVNGVATFSPLTVSAQAPSVRIAATGTGITGTFFSNAFIVNAPVNVLAGTPPSTTFTVQRTAASPAPAVVNLTASIQPITGISVGTITYGAGATGWLGAVLGVATTPTTLTLTATTGALPEGTFSASVTINSSDGAIAYPVTVVVTPLPVTQIVVITDPAGAESGANFITQPVVELRDATNTRVLAAANSVTASVNSGTGTIGGTVTRVAVQGRVTFTDLKITGTGAHTLAYNSGVLPPATSASFTVVAALSTVQAVPATLGDVNTLIPSFTPVTAAGGILPYTFALSGGILPGGMNFNTATGQITGTPTSALAITTFTVTVTDAALVASSKTFTLTVNPALTTTQVIAAKVGDNGTAIASFIPVTAAGGTPAITFAISPAATLTGVGLAFNTATGAVSGTPTGTLAITTFTVTATDAIGATSAKTFTLTVNAALTTTQAVAAKVGTNGAVMASFTPVTSAGGSAPVTFAISPAATLAGTGLTFNTATGAISGTPVATLALTTFTVTATDVIGATSSQTFTLTINPALTTTQVIPSTTGNQGTALGPITPVTAAGGSAPITFAVSPAATLTGIGLAFDVNTGALSGTPTGPIVATIFTVTATDAAGATSSKTFTLTVNGPLTTTQAIAAKVGTQGAALTPFTPVTAAGGTAPITFAISPAATLTGIGLSFNTATGAISGTPTAPLAVTTFTVTATDNIATTSSKTFTLTINPPVTTVQAVAATVGSQGVLIPTFTPVTAAGGTAPITFAVTPLATLTGAGMAFDVNTGAVSGTPSAALALTTFTVTATDAAGATSSKTFTLTVNGPVTTTQVIASKAGDNGVAIASFTPVTAAGGTAPITFAISPAATLTGIGMSFNTATGAVSGTPTGPLALTTFTVTATDNVGSNSSKTFTLTVNAALTTTQAVAATVGDNGTLIPTFTPVTAAGGTAPVTFAVSPAATLTGVGLAFNTATGAVSGTPTSALGLTTFTVTATDNIGATSSKTFTLQVNATLTTTQAVASKVGSQGTAIASFTPVTAAGGTAPITFAVSPAATLTGIGMAFDVNTGAVSGTPTGPLALTTFTVTATDNIGATSSKTFTLLVNGPLTTTQAIASKVGTQGAAIASFIPVTASGGTAPVTFAISPAATLTGIGMAFNTATGAVSGTPSGALAITTFTVTATDNIGATSSKTFTLQVNAALTTTQAVAATVGTQGTLIPTFTPVTAANGTAPITFAVTPLATLTGIGMAFDVNTGAVSGTPSAALGLTTFTVTATDAAGATSAKTFTLQVNGPVTTTQVIASKVGDNGVAIPSFTPVTAAGGTAPITFAISPAATLTGIGMSFNTANGAVSGTPTGPLALTTFTVTATDNVGGTSSKTFTLTVNASLTTTQAVASVVGDNGTLIPSFTPVTAAGGTAPITFAISPAAALAGAGLAFNTATGAVSGTPTSALALTTFTVTATDNIGATSSKTFSLQINATLTTTQAVASKTGSQGTAIPAFTPVTAAGGTAPITFAVSPAATLTGIGMSIDANTGAVSGTPTAPLVLTTFTVTATDNIGATSSKTFTLLVNGPLTTTQAVASKTGTSGTNIPTFTPVTAAGGTGTITFAISPAATLTGAGMSFNTSTGAVSGTPTSPLATTTFTVTATDAVAATSSKTFDLTINTALTTTQAVASAQGDVGVLVPTFTPVTAAGGTAPVTFAISPAPTLTSVGMSFNTSTGDVSGTPTGVLATTTFTVTATDNVGAVSSKTFSLTVNAALGTTQAVPTKNVQVNAVAAFTPVTASGGSAPITFAISPAATLTGTGLSFNTSTGAISGTATSGLATTTFTVTATDNVGATSSKTFDLQVYTGIVLDVGAGATATTNGGLDVAIPVSLDMSGRGPDDLAALTITLTWDASKFTFNAGASGVGSWPGGGFIQPGAPGSGTINITGFSTPPTTSNFTFYNLVLTANATASTVVSPVSAVVTTSANAAATPITVTTRNLSVTINP